MNATLTTNCGALDWVISHVSYTGSDEVHPDVNPKVSVIHNWAFRGKLNEKMVRDIQAFVTTAKQTQKTYGNMVVIDGYEIDCSELPHCSRARYDVSVIRISREA